MSQSAVGTIFNVQRFSLHDGPGMRDLIFLKGCRGAAVVPGRSALQNQGDNLLR